MIKPLGDRVLLEIIEENESKVGGILIANNAKEKPLTGAVVAISQTTVGDLNAPTSVKVGDQVAFDKYAGQEITVDGKDYLVVHEKDIVGVLN
ncbi:MAG: co-chaperone GroES [Lactobacillaceae bacterium]|jgi:chaperonin GroES|nr:co-chaperone GroES [Lactobacillaceae bacterium]